MQRKKINHSKDSREFNCQHLFTSFKWVSYTTFLSIKHRDKVCGGQGRGYGFVISVSGRGNGDIYRGSNVRQAILSYSHSPCEQADRVSETPQCKNQRSHSTSALLIVHTDFTLNFHRLSYLVNGRSAFVSAIVEAFVFVELRVRK